MNMLESALSSRRKWCEVFLIIIQAAMMHQPAAVDAIQMTDYEIPSHLSLGDSANLTCRYQLTNETLYSVRWYKDNEEFYNFIAAPKMHKRMYPVHGVRVDMAGSDAEAVRLLSVGFDTSGKYGCEISADAPTFDTAIATGHLLVIAPPDKPLKLVGVETPYDLGDKVQLNCSAATSRPIVLLNWLINGHQAPFSALVDYPAVRSARGWGSRTLGVQVRLKASMFPGGRLTLTCEARLANLYKDQASMSIRLPQKRSKNAGKTLEIKDPSGCRQCQQLAALGSICLVLISILYSTDDIV